MRSYHLLMLNKTLPGQPKESTVCAPPRVEFYKKKKREKSARMTQKHTHTNTHQGGKVRLHLSSLLPPLMSSSKQLPQK